MLFRTRPNKPELDATKVPTALDVAWAAGIFEGEGTVRLCGRTKRGLMVSIPQKDPELLYWLRDWFGGSVGRPTPKNCCHTWSICGDRCRMFLGLTYEFFTSRRKSQVEECKALEFLRGKSPVGMSTEDLKVNLESFYEEHRNTTWTGPNRSEIRRRNYQSRKASDPEFLATLNARNEVWREKQKQNSDNLVAIA
jgi:hypothetical protein